MTSPPPIARYRRQTARLALRNAPLGPGDRAVCFSIEDPSPLASSTRVLDQGGIEVATRVCGRVTRVEPGLILVADPSPVRVRHMLPVTVLAEPLLGLTVAVSVHVCLRTGTAPQVDATIRDADGELLLWAHDGPLPADIEAPVGLSVRLSHARSASARLAIVGAGAVQTMRAHQRVPVATADGSFELLVLGVHGDGAAFVAVRR